jgi:plastocyanin
MAAFLLAALVVLSLSVRTTGGEVVILIPRAVSHMPYGMNFWPSTVRVVLGVNSTVRWINLDDHVHTVTSSDWSFHSGELNLYDSFAYTFRSPGKYVYFCLPHPWMQGIVMVDEGKG